MKKLNVFLISCVKFVGKFSLVDSLKRVFTKSKIRKVFIVFTIGFLLRILINSLNVYYLGYCGGISLFVVFLHEVIACTYVPKTSTDVFNLSSIRKGFSNFLSFYRNKDVIPLSGVVTDLSSSNKKGSKLSEVLFMNESDEEYLRGESKETGVNESKETGVNESFKEVKPEDVSDKEVRKYWDNKRKREYWKMENTGSASFLESDGPHSPFNKEDYVRWLNGKYMNGNKNIHDRVYDSNSDIKSSKERDEELLNYWRFMLKGEGDTKYLPINFTSNELIYSRHKVLQEIIKSDKERKEELLKYWRFMLKGEGDPTHLPINFTSNEIIYSRYLVVQEIIKSNGSSNANVNSNSGNSN